MDFRKIYRLTFLVLHFSTVIKAQKEIPVLCYHQVRNWRSSDSKSATTYIVPEYQFEAHMKMLRDSGYHTITPGQLVGHLGNRMPLPSKPVLLSFDDGTDSQYLNALPVLQRYGFHAVFFIMTVTLDRPGYLSKKQVRTLSDKGFVIGCHTWDHHDVRKCGIEDWAKQLIKPTVVLQEICGKPVRYFAYPFGLWDKKAIAELQKQNYLAAFQLSGKNDNDQSMFTTRRIIADGHWSAQQLDAAIKRSFK